MHKKNYTNYTYLFLLVVIVFILPGSLQAHVTIDIILLASLIRLLPLISLIIIAALIKMWLLKRKLSIPWKWKPMEKLIIGTLAETVVELLILSLFVGFLVPFVISLVSDPPLTANLSENIKFVVHLLIALPFYCFLGAIFNVLLINLLTPLDKEQQRRYIKFGVLLTLIVPALLLIVFFTPQIFSKPPGVEVVPTD